MPVSGGLLEQPGMTMDLILLADGVRDEVNAAREFNRQQTENMDGNQNRQAGFLEPA